MRDNLEQQKTFEKETKFSTEERCEIQRRLIKKFCETGKISDTEKESICGENWVKEYADNFDQLDRELVESYKNAQNEEEKEEILDKIQETLEELNRVSG